MAENIKVAVRVRPFDDREMSHNSKMVIQMKGNQTTITSTSGKKNSFAFDYSYWSHDGYRVTPDGYYEPESPVYADQKRVFEDLGRGMLNNAWKGFNCSLFAYGQTGSGKSYSIIGYGPNKGIVPITCEQLFAGIEDKRAGAAKDDEWQVSVSMIEIYNEKVRDLLVTTKTRNKESLKIRQHQTKGFYVEGLSSSPVSSYAQIEAKIAEGSKNRSVAATNMNATSSRAHTIVAINFVQKNSNESGQKMTKSSLMNLVDLAGSERVGLTGAEGERMKEGAAINLSLSTLGNCISALADQAAGNTRVKVPFRDSVLTKLLQNALGGNSKTVMIAALSPADINYEETLSTLRFADRAKSIKTKAVVNESPTDKLIRELREENARLLKLLKSGGVPITGDDSNSESKEEKERELNELIKKNAEEMEAMERTWAERLAQAQADANKQIKDQEEQRERKKNVPHLWNLNADAALSGLIVHFCDPGSCTVGREGQVQLTGLSIQPRHAVLRNTKGKVTVTPVENAKVYINGKAVAMETELHHNDRVLFGNNHLYVFHHPVDYAKMVKSAGKGDNKNADKLAPPNFEDAQAELAANSGIMGLLGDSKGGGNDDLMKLKDDLVKLFPEVQEANAMAQEMQRPVKFELLLMSAQGRGLREGEGQTEVYIRLINLENNTEFLWPKDKFLDRKFLMRDVYNSFMDGEADWKPPEHEDPFLEPADTPVLIGTSLIYLESLAHLIEISQAFGVTNYKGDDQGKLEIEILPCDEEWNELTNSFAEPESLIANPLKFKIKVLTGKGLPKRFAALFCRYKYYLDDDYTTTEEVPGGSDPQFNFEKTYTVATVTQQFMNYLQNSYIIVELWGRQRDSGRIGGKIAQIAESPNDGAVKGGPSREGLDSTDGEGGSGGTRKLLAELDTVTKEKERAELKVKQLQSLLNEARKKGDEKIDVDALDNTLSATLNGGDQKKPPEDKAGAGSKAPAANAGGSSAVIQQKREDVMSKTVSKACVLQ
ncbi:hypothetical protein BOX15_Mlig019522g3 [Macrostomum lignano]|uniref:Kinesin-like protein 6 n=1 Tax=Macrostomum lignano TaxID=282301 RepID=A0A267DFY4_9PLAT|nr:hypothetical protein BOX15_Mlig019522g3 [Macrostomum lignano]